MAQKTPPARGRNFKLERLFQRGDYPGAIDCLERDSKGSWARDDGYEWAAGIGALAFGGRVREAKAYFELERERHSPEIALEARYYLGVGLVRVSAYEEARSLFAENLRLLRRLPGDGHRSRFFGYQGAGFYHYFDSRFQIAIRFGELAYAESIKASFLFGLQASTDLLGHLHCLRGSLKEGFAYFEQAERHGERLGHEAFLAGTRIAARIFRSQTEVKCTKALALLEELLGEADPKDTHSRSYLQLELASRLRISGNASAASKIVEEVSDRIYTVQNRRQAAELNFASARDLFSKGHLREALVLLKTAEQSLVPRVDIRLLLRTRGLSWMIARALGHREQADTVRSFIALHLERHGGFVSRRIQAREESRTLEFPRGQDPLGDLIDDLRLGDERAKDRAVRTGCLGLLGHYRPYSLGQDAQALVVDSMSERIFRFDRGAVSAQSFRASHQLRKLLARLAVAGASQPVSKEQLVREVWRYEYHPLRHDPLLHSSLARLRRGLGALSPWLEFQESGYRLRPGVQVLFDPPLVEEKTAEPVSPVRSPRLAGALKRQKSSEDVDTERSAELNVRQLKCVQWLRAESVDSTEGLASIGVREYAARFRTTRITASRDLSSLTEKGWTRAHGRARATRYVLKGV